MGLFMTSSRKIAELDFFRLKNIGKTLLPMPT